MAKATVTQIEFNAKLKDKWDGCYLHTLTEKGQKRKDFIFQKSDTFQVVKGLSHGDVVELKIEKNGEFYNLKDVVPTGEKSATPQAAAASSGYSKPASSGGGYKERYQDSKEYIQHKDLMIIRQTTMKASTDLVIAMLNKDMFKKTATADFLVEEIGRLASKLEAQVTGAKAIADLESSVESLDTSSSVAYDEDNPFN